MSDQLLNDDGGQLLQKIAAYKDAQRNLEDAESQLHFLKSKGSGIANSDELDYREAFALKMYNDKVVAANKTISTAKENVEAAKQSVINAIPVHDKWIRVPGYRVGYFKKEKKEYKGVLQGIPLAQGPASDLVIEEISRR